MKTVNDQRLYTTEEVAQKLEVHLQTVRRMIRAGKLHGIRIGRMHYVSEKSLSSYLGLI